MKGGGSKALVHMELDGCSAGEAGVIAGVAVKGVDRKRNTSGEGVLLECN